MLVILSLTAPAITARAGLDSYEIYLNSRLILQQYVNQPLNLRNLRLENAAAGDQLVIIYRHCNLKGAGTARSITLKDENDKVLKKWEFANSAGSDESMVIPVSELLSLKKGNNNLSIHYSAREHPGGEMLARLYLKEA